MNTALKCAAVGITACVIGCIVQAFVGLVTPGYLGTETFAGSLLVFPLLGLVAGKAAAAWTTNQRRLALVILANPATYWAIYLLTRKAQLLAEPADPELYESLVFLAIIVWLICTGTTGAAYLRAHTWHRTHTHPGEPDELVGITPDRRLRHARNITSSQSATTHSKALPPENPTPQSRSYWFEMKTAVVGLAAFGTGVLGQQLIRSLTPASLGAEAFFASLLLFPVASIAAGVVCALWTKGPARWIVVILGNPGLYWSVYFLVRMGYEVRRRDHTLGWWPFELCIAATVICGLVTGVAYRWTALAQWTTPPHLCPSCRSYLTRNVSGRCQECGTPVPANSSGVRE